MSLSALPPAPNKCQECATEHEPHEPHNLQSMYYQMRFEMEHGRKPTWDDAMAHCSEDMQEAWKEELSAMGVL